MKAASSIGPAASPGFVIPRLPREWRAAVDAAHACLAIDAARNYGLITTGIEVDVARCELILARGKELDYLPRPEAIENFIRALAGPRREQG